MSALIVLVELPQAIEAFRTLHVPTAAQGVPAHVTLLYPFLEVDDIDENAHASIAGVVAAHAAFDFRLADVRRWPTSAYLAIEPAEPFEALVRDLVEVFPAFPPSAGAYPFVPHVSLAEDDPDVSLEPIAPDLERLPSVRQRAESVVLIGRSSGEWLVRESFALRVARPLP